MNIINHLPLSVIIISVVIFFIVLILIFFYRKKFKSYNFNILKDCIKALDDKKEEVRVRACWSLAVHKSPEGETPLMDILHDQSRFVRGAAASALGVLKMPSSVKSLEDAIKIEQDEHTKAQMEKAVKKILSIDSTAPEIIETLDDLETVKINLNSPFDIIHEDKKDKNKINMPFIPPLPAIENSTAIIQEEEVWEIKIQLNGETPEAREILKTFYKMNSEGKIKININFENFRE